jgi:glycosyltransferase involved in cell wall biosynthesis
MPSVGAEGLPVVLSEAISRGVPVVGFDGGGLRHMKTFHKGVMIISQDEDVFKDALLEMRERLRDGALSESLIQHYRNELGNAKTIEWWTAVLHE